MHLLRTETRSLDETAPAVDLEQSRADLVALSFTDSDLAVLAKAWERVEPLAQGRGLRLASLADLRHPYSVDLYVEKVIAHARVVLIRLLGGLDYWRYGVDEIARLAREKGVALAFVPGDYMEDARLDAASTLPVETLRRLWSYMQSGGPDNAEQALRVLLCEAGSALDVTEPVAQAALGVFLLRRVRAADRHCERSEAIHASAHERPACDHGTAGLLRSARNDDATPARASSPSTAPPGSPATRSPTRRWRTPSPRKASPLNRFI